ncbi:hypothetical protein AVEN_36404-1 [Araneus ventricosus]|uniref:Uncharacterized protein n=1 Tax=Araneus ventricosus TaxID=182803 RepID=A0A4Y2UQM9_ARAVE|nr:hypothetical protein AVEN_36404-1 [Araneus ventricosus]
MDTKLSISTVVTAQDLFGTIHGSCLHWLLNRCHSSLSSVVDTLAVESESVVNSDKIAEDNCKVSAIFLLKFVTLLRLVTCGVRKERDLVCIREVDSHSLAALLYILHPTGILFYL